MNNILGCISTEASHDQGFEFVLGLAWDLMLFCAYTCRYRYTCQCTCTTLQLKGGATIRYKTIILSLNYKATRISVQSHYADHCTRAVIQDSVLTMVSCPNRSHCARAESAHNVQQPLQQSVASACLWYHLRNRPLP